MQKPSTEPENNRFAINQCYQGGAWGNVYCETTISRFIILIMWLIWPLLLVPGVRIPRYEILRECNLNLVMKSSDATTMFYNAIHSFIFIPNTYEVKRAEASENQLQRHLLLKDEERGEHNLPIAACISS